jgi:hypothetical protein
MLKLKTHFGFHDLFLNIFFGSAMGFPRPHSRQVAHVYYQLFDSKMTDGSAVVSAEARK